jgi:uncharacterized protein YdhG (YjbR/CyaY superfamily)
MTKAPSDIDAYLATLRPDKRAALQKLRRTIKAAAPDAEECISYRMPAFRSSGRLLVAYAGFTTHCSLFPCGSVKPFAKDLARYETVKARVAENDARGKNRRRV